MLFNISVLCVDGVLRTRGWRNLYNQELNKAWATFNQILLVIVKFRKMRWAEYVARMGELRSAHNILV